MIYRKYVIGINTLIFCLAIIYSCTNDNVVASHSYINKVIPYTQDSIIKNSRQGIFLQNLGNLMELEWAKNPTEGESTRIWFWNFGKKFVVEIYNNSSSPKCIVTEFEIPHTDSGDYIVIHNKWNISKPRSGWVNFNKLIKKYNICCLNGGEEASIKKERLTSMYYVQFEVKTGEIYRFYEYLEPSFYKSTDSESENVYNFLINLNNELALDVYNTTD